MRGNDRTLMRSPPWLGTAAERCYSKDPRDTKDRALGVLEGRITAERARRDRRFGAGSARETPVARKPEGRLPEPFPCPGRQEPSPRRRSCSPTLVAWGAWAS